MTDIKLETEWQDGSGIQGAELASTFAALRLEIRGEIVTKVHDRRAMTVRDSIYVPLYPVAEWIVSNWWFLGHEFGNPAKKGTASFRRRHALGTSTDGYALPRLEIVSSGSRTQIDWGGESSSRTKVDFLGAGHASVAREEFLNACQNLIDRVIRRLVAFDIHDTFLQEEWAAIQGSTTEESDFCKIAAGLGWDPYALDDLRRRQVLQVSAELGNLGGEAIPVLDSTNPVGETRAIISALKEAESNHLQLKNLRRLMRKKPIRSGYPWDVGYALAREVRRGLHLNGQPIPTLESLAGVLNEDLEVIDHATRPIARLDSLRLIDGVVVTHEHERVSIGMRRVGQLGRRFLFCRALGEVIASDGQSLITRGHTERQQRNRAFAAEFLAPSTTLRQRISNSILSADEVDDLAEEFGVSTQVVIHQLQNHRIAQVSHELHPV